MITLTFEDWEAVSRHLHHNGFTSTGPLPCYHAQWRAGQWTPEQDMTRCTCGLRQMLAEAQITP